MAMPLEISVMGPVGVSWEGNPVPVKPSGLRVVALLASRSGREVPTVEIIDAQWPDVTEDKGKNRLRVAIHGVREALKAVGAPDPFVSNRGTYGLDPEICEIDADRFEAAIRTGRSLSATHPSGAIESYESALGVYSEDASPYESCLDLDFAASENRRLSALRSSVISELIDLRVEAGGGETLAEQIRREIKSDPLNERLYASLMMCEYRSGRQAEALRVASEARSVIATELGLTSHPYLEEMEDRILARDPMLLDPVEPIQIPDGDQQPTYQTGLFGRSDELQKLLELADVRSVVTIVGPGGAGKTRLAVEAFGGSDSYVFVDLTRVRRDSDIRPTVAAALGIRDELADVDHVITSALSKQPSILVMDNCEHVADHAARLVGSLAALPDLTIVATSREPLGLDGEAVLAVRGLAVEPGDELLSEAASMFVDRVGRSLSSFEPDQADRATIEAICTLRDGLPLAIELAAAWVSYLSLAEIRSGLEGAIDLPGDVRRTETGRHESMEATVRWSYELLNDRDRLVFRRASLLASGFTTDVVTLMCDDMTSDAVRRSLHRLVTRQLIDRVGWHTPTRYRMLESIRSFGVSVATEEDVSRVTENLGSWADVVCEDARPRIEGAGRVDLFGTLALESPNVVQASRLRLDAGDASLLCRTVWLMQPFIISRGALMGEFMDLFGASRALLGAVDPLLRSRALTGIGVIAYQAGRMGLAEEVLGVAVAVAIELGDSRAESNAADELGKVYLRQGRTAEAREAMHSAVAASKKIGDAATIARDLASLAGIEAPEQQLECIEQAKDLLSSFENDVTRSFVLAQGAWLEVGLGLVESGLEQCTRCVDEYSRVGLPSAAAEMMWSVADCQMALGDMPAAIASLDAAMETARESGDGECIAIAAARVVDAGEYQDATSLLAEAREAAGEIVGLHVRIDLAEGRNALRGGDNRTAERLFQSALDRSLKSAFPSWRASALLGLASVSEDGGTDRFDVRCAQAYREALEGPFVLDGAVHPDLGSLAAIATVVEALRPMVGVDVVGKPIYRGLQGVAQARDDLTEIIDAEPRAPQ